METIEAEKYFKNLKFRHGLGCTQPGEFSCEKYEGNFSRFPLTSSSPHARKKLTCTNRPNAVNSGVQMN